MHGGKRAGRRIAQQDRNTIGRLDPEQNVRGVADQSITVLVIPEHTGPRTGFGYGTNDPNVGAVYLPTTGQRPIAVEQFEKAAPVLVNVFRVVFIKAGEVQRVFRHGADAAATG